MIYIFLFSSQGCFFYKSYRNITYLGNTSDSGGGNKNDCDSNSGTFITISDPSFGQERYPIVKYQNIYITIVCSFHEAMFMFVVSVLEFHSIMMSY